MTSELPSQWDSNVGESTGAWWIPLTKGQWVYPCHHGCFHPKYIFHPWNSIGSITLQVTAQSTVITKSRLSFAKMKLLIEYIKHWGLDGRLQCYGNGDSTVLYQAIDSDHFWVASSRQCMYRVCTLFWFALFCCACFFGIYCIDG